MHHICALRMDEATTPKQARSLPPLRRYDSVGVTEWTDGLLFRLRVGSCGTCFDALHPEYRQFCIRPNHHVFSSHTKGVHYCTYICQTYHKIDDPSESQSPLEYFSNTWTMSALGWFAPHRQTSLISTCKYLLQHFLTRPPSSYRLHALQARILPRKYTPSQCLSIRSRLSVATYLVSPSFSL